MKLDLITNNRNIENSLNPNDEFYTPKYAITPIIKYLKSGVKFIAHLIPKKVTM